jgi:hypothetical protein
MASDRGSPLDSSQVQTGSTNMANIIENASRISKSCNRYKPKITKAILIKTAAKRRGYGVSLYIVENYKRKLRKI